MKSYRALLRMLLAPQPPVPIPTERSDFPPMRVIRAAAVLSEGSGR